MKTSEIKVIARREIRIRLKSKPVLVSSLIFLAIAIASPFFTASQGDVNKKESISLLLDVPAGELQGIKERFSSSEMEKYGYEVNLEERAITPSDKKFREKGPDVLVSIRGNEFRIVASDRLNPIALNIINSELSRYRESQYFNLNNYDVSKYYSWTTAEVEVVQTDLQKMRRDRGETASILIVFLYSLLSISSGFLAMSVIEEKSSKVIEVILNTTSARDLLIGKITGVMIFAFSQFSITTFAFYLSSYISGSEIALKLSILKIVFFLLWILIALSTYAFLYGGLSALVARSEDIGAVQGPLGVILIASLYLSIYSINSSSHSVTGLLLYAPLINLLGIPVAVVMGTATGIQLIVSISLAIVEMCAIIIFMIRVYESFILRTGQIRLSGLLPISLRRSERIPV
jgi:ABC-2 type transport system permease protein